MEAILGREVWRLSQAQFLAVSAHHSLLSDRSSDDPGGLRLPAQIIAESQEPWGLFFCRK